MVKLFRQFWFWIKTLFATPELENVDVVLGESNSEIFIEENNMKKISLHFGICRFDENYYGPGNNLRGCENDAKYAESLAKKKGFETHLFLSEQATYNVYVEFLKKMAAELVAGDTFFFSISCHGTYQEYMERGEEKRKTALCLHDRIVWDYETKQLLMQFQPGVKIIWMADCCHARDNFKSLNGSGLLKGTAKFLDFSNIRQETLSVKQASEEEQVEEQSDLKCTIIAYSSSTEQQVSYDLESFVDGRPLGLFTASMEKVLLSPSNQKLSYFQLYKKISQQIVKADYPQTPKLQTVNGRQDNLVHREFLS